MDSCAASHNLTRSLADASSCPFEFWVISTRCRTAVGTTAVHVKRKYKTNHEKFSVFQNSKQGDADKKSRVGTSRKRVHRCKNRGRHKSVADQFVLSPLDKLCHAPEKHSELSKECRGLIRAVAQWAAIPLVLVKISPASRHAFEQAASVDHQQRNGRDDDDGSDCFPVLYDQASCHKRQWNEHVVFPRHEGNIRNPEWRGTIS